MPMSVNWSDGRAGRETSASCRVARRSGALARRSDARAPQPADIDADADGFGHTNATRGTLMHWVRLREGRISTYQVITPTTWNASPRDTHAVPGHFEQSLVGLPADEDGRGISHSSSVATILASCVRPSSSVMRENRRAPFAVPAEIMTMNRAPVIFTTGVSRPGPR